MHIRMLTNSLASTDAPIVHNGYARYRVALLRMGVELSEVRPKLGQKRARFHPFKSSNASLHAKALVIDQRTVFIGSLNMDERSARFNSELGLVMRSPGHRPPGHEPARRHQRRRELPAHARRPRPDRLVERRRRVRRRSGTATRRRRLATLRVEAARAVRARGAALAKRGRPHVGGDAHGGEVVLHLGAKSLAARHRGAAGEHQDEIPAQGAVHLAQIVHVHQAGAADAEHGLGAQRLLGLAQGAARVIRFPADSDDARSFDPPRSSPPASRR